MIEKIKCERKLKTMELHVATLLKEKIFLTRLNTILFQMLALITPTNLIGQIATLFKSVTTIFQELQEIIKNTHSFSIFAQSVQELEERSWQASAAAITTHSTYVQLVDDEQLLLLVNPISRIAQRSKTESITAEDISELNNLLKNWLFLPHSTKWSVTKSVAVIQLGANLLTTMCDRTKFQPIFESNINLDTGVIDANLNSLKSAFIQNFEQVLNNFMRIQNDPSVAYSLPECVSIEAKTRAEIIQVINDITFGIKKKQLSTHFTPTNPTHTLPGVDIFLKKLELCKSTNLASILNNDAQIKALVNKIKVPNNILSMLMFNQSVFQSILSQDSQKQLMFLVIEWLIGLLATSNIDLRSKIYNVFNCVEIVNKAHDTKLVLDQVLYQLDLRNTALKRKCGELGIDIDKISLTSLGDQTVRYLDFIKQ